MSARSVNLTGRQQDHLTNHPIAMSEVHARIHQGVFFGAQYSAASVADGSSINVLITTTANGGAVHMRVSSAAGGNATLYVFEDPTVSVAGTAVSAYNRNRTSALTPTTVITHTPTNTPDGTQIAGGFLPGGRGGNAAGNISSMFEEIIMKANEQYLIRLTNNAGTAQPLSVVLDWYEPAQATT